MKTFKQFKEDAPVMSATGVTGGGPIAGLPPDFPPVAAGVTTGNRVLRRKKPVNMVKRLIRNMSGC